MKQIEKHKTKMVKESKSDFLKYCEIDLDLSKSRTRLNPSKIKFAYYTTQDLHRYHTFLDLIFCDYQAIKKIKLDKHVASVEGLQAFFKPLKEDTIRNRIRLLIDINRYLFNNDNINTDKEIKYLEGELNV
jgi:hypothetical protein